MGKITEKKTALIKKLKELSLQSKNEKFLKRSRQ